MNKREVRTPYSLIWSVAVVISAPSLIEGRVPFHLSVWSAYFCYKWCRDQDASLGGLSRYRIWLMILGERSVSYPGCGWSGDK